MPTLSSVEQCYHRYALYERGYKPNTVRQTLSILKRLRDFSEIDRIELLSTSVIRDFLQIQREQKGWSAKTFRLYRQYMKTFFDWVISEGYVKSNPVTPIAQPPIPQSLPRCLSQDEALKVMAHVHWNSWYYELEKSRNEAIFATFLFTGIRLSELLNLRCSQVSIEQNEIHVLGGKNEKDRNIPILPQLKPILTNYIQARKRLGTPSIWFFPSVKSDKRLTAKNLHSIFRKISQCSGVKVTPHMLRHTFGRICVESNINMRIVQYVLGHSRIETTQVYTFVSTKASQQGMKDFALQI